VIDGVPVIDAHVHTARIPTLKMSWDEWTVAFSDRVPRDRLYDRSGSVIPAAFHDYLEEQGIDLAFLMAEYSPKVTGIQAVEDLLPIVEHDPMRVRFIAALNPHLHFPVRAELERQLALGAVALKLHPVHGGYPPNTRELYPAYALCEERRVPAVFHCGTSVYAGATNRYADPALIDEVARDFPDLSIVLAHGGRGWWYDAAAFLALVRPRVWIEISGLPPRRLPEYYARHDFARLAKRMIFGSDWPGAPGIGVNAQAVLALGLDRDTVERVLYRNAMELYATKGETYATRTDAARGGPVDRAGRVQRLGGERGR
jgi:predicted TIM-barrel fold metal-dependent hydrolase